MSILLHTASDPSLVFHFQHLKVNTTKGIPMEARTVLWWTCWWLRKAASGSPTSAIAKTKVPSPIQIYPKQPIIASWRSSRLHLHRDRVWEDLEPEPEVEVDVDQLFGGSCLYSSCSAIALVSGWWFLKLTSSGAGALGKCQ